MKQTNETPFVFGIKVKGDAFTDRREETENLRMNFTYGVNTILISPRRMGKTSLVDKVCSIIENENIRIVKIDAFGCRSENDFINAFATAVIRATSDKWEEWMQNAKMFLSRFVPKISLGPDPLSDFSVALEYNSDNRSTEEILQLPEVIAQSKGIKIIVCIDEFQQIGDFYESLTFQKKLRSVWQHQSNVTYCLYGSRKHMMEKMFQDQSYPFYRFGDIFYLKKISEADWIEYICRKFSNSGKSISAELAKKICEITDRYSSYVQQLAWFVWLRTEGFATADDLQYGIERLIDACEPVFIQQTESLSSYQMNFLHALSDGIHNGFTQGSVLNTYKLGTPANISRLKKSLTEKDLIAITSPHIIEITDPILKLWLKKRIWKENL